MDCRGILAYGVYIDIEHELFENTTLAKALNDDTLTEYGGYGAIEELLIADKMFDLDICLIGYYDRDWRSVIVLLKDHYYTTYWNEAEEVDLRGVSVKDYVKFDKWCKQYDLGKPAWLLSSCYD